MKVTIKATADESIRVKMEISEANGTANTEITSKTGKIKLTFETTNSPANAGKKIVYSKATYDEAEPVDD